MTPGPGYSRMRAIAPRRVAGWALIVVALAAGCAKNDHSNPVAPNPVVPSLSGTVYLPRGTPASRAEVSLAPGPGNVTYDPRLLGIGMPTNAAGEFSFDTVASGNYEIVAGMRRDTSVFSFGPYDSLVTAAPVTIPDPPRPVTGAHLTLQRPGVFRGRVSSATGALPPEVQIYCLQIFSDNTVADAGGDFVLPGIPVGTWRLAAVGLTGTNIAIAFGGELAMPAAGDTVDVPDFVLPALSARQAALDALPSALSRTIDRGRAGRGMPLQSRRGRR